METSTVNNKREIIINKGMNKKYDYDKRYGIAISVLIIFFNLYLSKFTYQIAKERGGPMGFGLLILPFLFTYHILLITSIKEIVTKQKSFSTYVINCIGLLWIIVGVGIVIIINL